LKPLAASNLSKGPELMTDPRTLPNDRFGYSVHSLVSRPSREQVRLVSEVREAVGQARAVIPAHVTIRGTFYGIDSLEEMRGLLRQTAAGLGRPGSNSAPAAGRFTATTETATDV
jgi:hypothetical protein